VANSYSNNNTFENPYQQASDPKRSRGDRQERGPGPPLPPDYVPSPLDICSGRGKKNWNLEGNVVFRSFIQTKVGDYIAAQTKMEKTQVVVQILQTLRNQGFQFLKQNKDKRYYDIGDKEARDKVGHSLRDQVTALKQKEKSSREHPTTAPLYPPEEPKHQRRPSLALSDGGNETEMRRSALESTTLFKAFARRPSWIVGEDASAWECVDQYMELDIDSSDSATKHDDDIGECHDHVKNHHAAEMSESVNNHHQLMKNSILSFDDRMSILGSNARMSAMSNPRMSTTFTHGGSSAHRLSLIHI